LTGIHPQEKYCSPQHPVAINAIELFFPWENRENNFREGVGGFKIQHCE